MDYHRAANKGSFLGKLLCFLTGGRVVPAETYQDVVQQKNDLIDQMTYKLNLAQARERRYRGQQEAATKELKDASGRWQERVNNLEARNHDLRKDNEEKHYRVVRLADALDIVRQTLDEAGVPCKHEVEADDGEDEVGPDEVADDDHRY